MVSALMDIADNLAAAVIGALAMYLAVWAKQRVRQRAVDRAVRRFFGFPGPTIVVHSAIVKKADGIKLYSYPATDIRAARTLSRFLESVGLREGTHFTIHPDRSEQGLPVDQLSKLNVVLLCGPARNEIFAKVAEVLTMRYWMTLDDEGRNLLRDHRREEWVKSSRDKGGDENGKAYDFGLIASLPNPYNSSRRLVILAGIHGTGTVGAAEFVANLDNIRTLDNRRSGETISEIVRVDYAAGDIESPTHIELA